MFVDRSAVPDSAAMEYTPPEIISDFDPQEPVDPLECGPVFWGPKPVQSGMAGWSTTTSPETATTARLFNLSLQVPAERPDFARLIDRCRTVRYQGITATASPLTLPRLPDWAHASRIHVQGSDGVTVIGLCRGLYIAVAFTQKPGGELSPQDSDAVVTLFNAQVSKLEAI